MFLFAFNTFARIGEIALTSRDCLKSLVSIEDIQIIYTKKTPCRVSGTFRNFKHSKGKPHVLELDRGETKVSSIKSLMAYLKLHGKQTGPLFILNNGQVILQSHFDTQLKKCLFFVGLTVHAINHTVFILVRLHTELQRVNPMHIFAL